MFHPFRKRKERKAIVQEGKDVLARYNARAAEVLQRLSKPSQLEEAYEARPIDEEDTDVGPWSSR